MRVLLLLALLCLPAPARAEQSACLAAFASRYIGETERNLSGALALAAQNDVVLQFDEADALFGERSDVHAGHDRFANRDVAALLARIERFGGLAHLSSNRRRALAAGFERRSRQAGILVIETETGARVLEFSRANRAQAMAYAEATLRACPPADGE